MALKIINRIDVGKATWYGVIFICITAVLPFLALNYYTLIGALFVYGAANGFIGIAMNTLVTEIEKEKKKFYVSSSWFF